jgi:hypothetical protein
MVAAGTITLSDDFTAGGDATLIADDGINVNGHFTAAGDIVLNGDANASVDGNDTITLENWFILESTTGSITFDSDILNLAGYTIRAANGIDVNGDFIAQGTTTINADTDFNGTGDFTVSSAGSLTGSVLSITANDFHLMGSVSGSAISLNVSDLGSIGIGNAVGDMTLDGSELQLLQGSLFIGGSGNSGVTVDGVSISDVANIDLFQISSAGQINFSGGASTFNSLHAHQSNNNGINVDAAVLTATGDIHLNSAGTININADVSSAAYAYISSGVILTTGATISASRLDLVVSQEANVSTDVDTLIVSGAPIFGSAPVNITVNNLGGLSLGGSTTGNLSVTAGGAVTHTALFSTLAVAGTTNINAAGFDITLDNASNDFTGAVSVTGANVTLVDTSAIDLGASTITGTLSVLAGGDIVKPPKLGPRTFRVFLL